MRAVVSFFAITGSELFGQLARPLLVSKHCIPWVISMPAIVRSFCTKAWIGMLMNWAYGSARIGGITGAALTMVLSDAMLFAPFGSATAEETLALLVSVPAAFGLTTIVTLATAPPAVRLPSWQITVVPKLHVPWLGVTASSATPAGNASVTFTAVAVLGPAL